MRMVSLMSRVILLFLVSNLFAGGITIPEAPEVQVKGTPGNREAAYWVIAKDKEGYYTCPSKPTLIKNLPDQFSKEICVNIQVKPVKGAVEYLVLKTIPMPPIKEATVTPAAPGKHKFYYWIQWDNNWHQSALGGPFGVECKNPAGKGNVIKWNPLPNASWYNVYRTETPEPPLGRGFFGIAFKVGAHKRFTWMAKGGPTEVVDKGKVVQTVCAQTATPVTEPPLGSGLWVVGKTTGKPVIDSGQPLTRWDVSNVNATERTSIHAPKGDMSDIVSHLGAQYLIRSQNHLKHLRTPSFGAGHLETLVVENNIYSGGHSEYHMPANGVAGWKSWINAIAARVNSHTSSQHGALTAGLTSYGGGDAIPFDAHVNMYGPNNDAGDEGAYPVRTTAQRILSAYNAVLKETVPKGGTWLPLEKLAFNQAGTERVVVNLTKSHSQGRIKFVNNVIVEGKGTNWTKEMERSWISFDVDNVKDYRMWYWITEVKGPEELVILAKTGWSYQCNLGYSRFIWDPETSKGPHPVGTNMAAIRKLPEERMAAAKSGKYLLCPGVQLADPWKEGNSLHVEPILQQWSKGDKVRIVAGPQAYIALARFMLHGGFLPQDQVNGITVSNTCNRPTNFAGIAIGNPGQANFKDGIRIALANNGAGDGIVISAANHWDKKGWPAGSSGVYRAAIVVPNEIPAMCGNHNWRYPSLIWKLSKDGKADAMHIAMKNGPVAASFDRDGRTTLKRVEVTDFMSSKGKATLKQLEVTDSLIGSDKVRGRIKFSGNGTQKLFKINFKKPLHKRPVVTFNTNQFVKSRLKKIERNGFTIEFKNPPEAGNNNITIWWIAIE